MECRQIGPEVLNSKPEIHIERLYHPPSISPENAAIFARFLAGDKTAHTWNREAMRIKAYNPLYLVIDSLNPNVISSPTQIVDSTNIWLSLPGSPSELNDKGIVTALAGDVSYNNALPFFINNKMSPEESTNAASKLDTYSRTDDLGQSFANSKLNLAGQLVELGIENIALALPMALLTKSLLEKILSMRMTRRTLLQKVPAVAGVLAFGGIFGGLADIQYEYAGGEVVAFAKTEQQAQQIQAIAAIMRTRVERSVWVDGRTALMYVKLKNYMQDKNGTGSEIVGYTHDPSVLGSDETNGELIYAYIKDIAVTQDEILDSQRIRLDREEKLILRKELLAYVAKTDMYTVVDPGNDINMYLPDAVANSVKSAGSFQSREVENITKDLLTA